jgi:flagellar hook-basal body complex protein FliE
MIEAISAIGTNALANVAKPQAAAATDFSQMLGDGISKLDTNLKVADEQLRAMAAGKEVAVHDVMITMEEARMNLMFMVEVRNRCVEAYQELMRMQL